MYSDFQISREKEKLHPKFFGPQNMYFTCRSQNFMQDDIKSKSDPI